MKLLSWFFPADKSETGDIKETVGALAITPDDLATELTELKAESEKRFAAASLQIAEARGREQALSDQLEAKQSAYRSLLSSIEDKDTRIAELEIQLAEAKESADKVANQKLRQSGHAPLAVVESDSGSILEQYRKIPFGKDKIAFQKKHKAELENAIAQERKGLFV